MFTVALWAYWYISLFQSDAYKKSLFIAEASPAVRELLGDGIKVSPIPLGYSRPFRNATFAEWSVVLGGSRDKGHLYGVATRVNGTWEFSRLSVVAEKNEQRVELTQATPLQFAAVPPKTVYLVRLGLLQGADLYWAPTYYKAKFGIDVRELPSIPLDQDSINKNRDQLDSDKGLDLMRRAHPDLARDPSAILVGITSDDMYIPDYNWEYAENVRAEGRFALLSIARIRPATWLAIANPEWLNSRLQKVLTKNIAMLYFGVPMSQDSTSMLAGGVLTGTEIDQVGGQLIGADGKWDGIGEAGDPAVTIYDNPGKPVFWSRAYTREPVGDTNVQVFTADLSMGMLYQRKTDFIFDDAYPLQLARTYTTGDEISRSFGIGTMSNLDEFLIGQMGSYIELVMEDGIKIHFDHTTGDTYEQRGSAWDKYQGAKAVYHGTQNMWSLTTNDGWTHFFPYRPQAQAQNVTVLTSYEDSAGHKYEMMRNAAGVLVSVTTPSGKWLHFDSDEAHRITRITASTGRVVNYAYDSGGRLSRVEDSEGHTDLFTYDEKGRMLRVLHGGDRQVLENEYSGDGYLQSQLFDDGRKFEYHYLRGPRNVTYENTIRDPNGLLTVIKYGRGGYSQSLPFRPPH